MNTFALIFLVVGIVAVIGEAIRPVPNLLIRYPIIPAHELVVGERIGQRIWVETGRPEHLTGWEQAVIHWRMWRPRLKPPYLMVVEATVSGWTKDQRVILDDAVLVRYQPGVTVRFPRAVLYGAGPTIA